MPYYAKIVKSEDRYFEAKRKIIDYDGPESYRFLIAFVFFIVPGVLMIVPETKKREQIEEHNRIQQGIMSDAKRQAQNLIRKASHQ